MRHRRSAILAFVSPVLLACVIASCGGGGDGPAAPAPTNNTNNPPGGTGNPPGGGGPPSTATVTVTSNLFTPSAVTLARNGTVTWNWTNDGYGTPHNVTFDAGGGSGDKTDGTYERTFTTAGAFTYRCTNHGGMTGTITVQ